MVVDVPDDVDVVTHAIWGFLRENSVLAELIPPCTSHTYHFPVVIKLQKYCWLRVRYAEVTGYVIMHLEQLFSQDSPVRIFRMELAHPQCFDKLLEKVLEVQLEVVGNG